MKKTILILAATIASQCHGQNNNPQPPFHEIRRPADRDETGSLTNPWVTYNRTCPAQNTQPMRKNEKPAWIQQGQTIRPTGHKTYFMTLP